MDIMLIKLRNKIRHGEEPDNPMLISLWLSFEEDYRDINKGNSSLEVHYEQQFNLLLETIADELIPVHWRRVCLDNIYKPLSSLRRIAKDTESQHKVSRLLYELSVTCRYLEGSLQQ